jgi:hypothetical protein
MKLALYVRPQNTKLKSRRSKVLTNGQFRQFCIVLKQSKEK